ncbi:adenylate/guanylate cyclase domain-containing protein [Nocardioides zeae]|uniref:Adenylate/guanylate cyclase domain-containing protein n=1 Tax=Nocardioides imazamoxiresistens TaxID=3231893 RepID=A0ABU3PT76_9ACTN|nr:adenylate/guanylate cyclase domain-containing protein [Nocardioides zeae]MDT9592426.1 adenylate/guanylate cyclase domain-containing protein [Nocardioides zeae]
MSGATHGVYGSRLLGRPDQSARALRVRVQVLLTFILLVANLVGAVVVVALLLLVRPDEPLRDGYWLAHVIAVPVYVAVAVLVGTVTITRRLLAALLWARENRPPTEAEQRATLRAPLAAMVRQGGLWAAAVVLFTGLAVVLQPSLALTEGIAVSVAGVIVCAISLLWTEFVLRPITARALSAGVPPRRRGSGVRRRLVVFWAVGTGVPVAVLMLAALLALTGDEQLGLTRLAVVVMVLGGVVMLFGFMITGLTARSVVGPIASVQDALEQVRRGRLDVEVPVYDASELGHLQAGFNEMAAGLRERERIRDLFGRHVGQEVAAAAVGGDVELGGETREVTVLFVDLMGSTTLATRLEPTEVVTLLNRFCAVVVDEVDRAGGLVNKFMGDAVLAVFGAPVENARHAEDGLRAARAIARRLAAEVPEVEAGVGVATGNAVAGNVGDERRFEYTVIGDAVNSAARLTELAKRRPGRVLAAAATVEAAAADEAARWSVEGAEVLRGRGAPTRLAVPREEHAPAEPQASETSSA